MTGEPEARPRSLHSPDQESTIPPVGGTPPRAGDFAQGSIGETSDDRAQGARDRVWTVAEKTRDELATNVEPAKRYVDENTDAGARTLDYIAQCIFGAATTHEPRLPL